VSLYSVSSAADLTVALQYPATSSRLPSHSSQPPATTVVHDPDENVSLHFSARFWFTLLQLSPTPALPTTSASTTIRSRLRYLSNLWPTHTGHALPPIVSVPLAQGKEVCLVQIYVIEVLYFNSKRNAAAGAPKGDGFCSEDACGTGRKDTGLKECVSVAYQRVTDFIQ
jgi:hypothetical protein